MKFKDNVIPSVKIRFSANNGFFGPGVCRLLQLIDEKGSIQEACDEMELSYSKGRKMINKLQKECDFIVVEKKSGGINGGSTTLTNEGRELVNKYLKMRDKLQMEVDQLFKEYFGE